MYPNKALCPNWARESIDRYVQDGVPCGDFLTAVLGNDLKEAIGRADEDSLEALPHIVAYLYNDVPSNVWGSYEEVSAHIKKCQQERNQDERSPN